MKISEYNPYLDKGSRLAALGRLADGERARRARQRIRRRDVEHGDRRCDRGAENWSHGGWSLVVEEVKARPEHNFVGYTTCQNHPEIEVALVFFRSTVC